MTVLQFINYALFAVLGLITGSFVSALSYRLPRGLPMLNDRSRCPKCKKKISWHDNIPLFSYLLLGGKCRRCHKKILIRYPLLELSTAILFLLTYLCFNAALFMHSLTVVLVIAAIMIAIFMTDIEKMIIPDKLVFAGLLITILSMVWFSYSGIYQNLLVGLGLALFLLLIHIFTQGKGMGLGDVKLAVFIGTFLGYKQGVVWLFLAFMIGAMVGIILIVMRAAKLKDKVAFGPFLVVSFFIILLFGDKLSFLALLF